MGEEYGTFRTCGIGTNNVAVYLGIYMTIAYSDNFFGGAPKKVSALSYSLGSLYVDPALNTNYVIEDTRKNRYLIK